MLVKYNNFQIVVQYSLHTCGFVQIRLCQAVTARAKNQQHGRSRGQSCHSES